MLGLVLGLDPKRMTLELSFMGGEAMAHALSDAGVVFRARPFTRYPDILDILDIPDAVDVVDVVDIPDVVDGCSVRSASSFRFLRRGRAVRP
ncbi:MAG: hypothetical protein IPK13_02650 [Deltaproteobacteria bacterium]|nr:hypothetical protein [Deltaproteobacteria bacterium]